MTKGGAVRRRGRYDEKWIKPFAAGDRHPAATRLKTPPNRRICSPWLLTACHRSHLANRSTRRKPGFRRERRGTLMQGTHAPAGKNAGQVGDGQAAPAAVP
jgi:hypothetical protein